jgi:hypothetical protein
MGLVESSDNRCWPELAALPLLNQAWNRQSEQVDTP